MDKPLVSVVMGVHNEKEEYLKLAIDSICNQTYNRIEFVIIDDFSNENCKRVLSDYSKQYDFIHVIHNDMNLGLTKSLNIGIRVSKGELIARMDADDFSVPTRLEKQVSFLSNNPEIDICGTGVVSFGDTTVYMSPFRGFSNDEAQCCLFFSSTLCHPSVMIRRTFLEKNSLLYDENVKKGQDYDLWEHASIVGKLAVMKEVMLYYRLHSEQITSSHKGEQDFYADIVRLRRLSRLGLSPTRDEYKCHMLLAGGYDETVKVTDVESWMNKLINANNCKLLVNKNDLARDLQQRFVLFKLRNKHYSCLLHIADLKVMVKVFIKRPIVRIMLNLEGRKFNKLVKNV